MLFLDTEFNGYHGELISMAIVPDFDKPFYEVRSQAHNKTTLSKWVQDNVIPVLNKEPVNDYTFQVKLWNFLRKYDNDTIVADWPEDIAHFMWWYCGMNGMRPSMNFKMMLITAGTLEPEIPHNALSDALALQKWYHA